MRALFSDVQENVLKMDFCDDQVSLKAAEKFFYFENTTWHHRVPIVRN